MDYKTILIVGFLLGLPTIVLVIAKLISMIRQGGVSPVESVSDVSGRDRDSGENEFGNGESADVGLTTMEVFDYLEEAVTCRDPAGKESFEELTKQDDSSDEVNGVNPK